jgi:hypothetical protein
MIIKIKNFILITKKNKCSNLGLVRVSDQLEHDINCLGIDSKYIYASAQNNIYADYRITAATTGVVSSFASRIVGIGGSTYTIPNAAVYQVADTVAQTGVTITNSYGLYIGNMADPVSGGSVTNSWGVYQSNSSNKNYFAGFVSIGSRSYSGVDNACLSVNGGNSQAAIIQIADNSKDVISCWNQSTSGSPNFISFYTENSPTARGSIYYSRGAGQVVYGVSSDVRLKENIVDAPSALEKINSVKIRSFDWKETGIHTDFGVVAQELVTVAPEAVVEGAENPEESIMGEKQYWQVDTSILVPAMIKAMQEQQAIIEDLKSRIEVLEAK